MQINKLYISLKHWPALPPPGLAEKACGALWRLLLGPQVLDLFLFGKKSFRRFYSAWTSFRMHLPYLIVEICNQRALKK